MNKPYTYFKWAFTGGSDGKESSCNAGDLDLIPGLGSKLKLTAKKGMDEAPVKGLLLYHCGQHK